ncbi:MAG: peptide chain release factor N(5)-glutamine methyltransferase [Mycoplasma sp.]
MTYEELIEECWLKLSQTNYSKNSIHLLIYNFDKHVKNIMQLTSYYKNQVSDEVIEKVLNSIDEIIDSKPLTRILKHTWFLGQEFIVNDNVLIPRPETEYITEIIIKKLEDIPNLKILDLCCGSGVIGLTIKKQILNASLSLSDISDDAIENTKQNAKKLNLEVEVIKSDLFQSIINFNFNVIVCNPPYISKNYKLEKSVLQYDPSLALFADDEGLFFYKKICDYLVDTLPNKFFLAFEIGYNQAHDLKEIIKKTFGCYPEVIKDQYNCDRLVILDKL